MNRFTFSFVLFGVLSLVFAISTFAQTQAFSDANVEYTFDLPDPIWKAVVKPTAGNPNVEYVYGDRLDGHLEIKRITVKENELLSEIIERDEQKLSIVIVGYVAGKQEEFAGTLKGKVFNYEFTRFGKTMSGRFYYLKANDNTVYVLRFTGLRDKLRVLRNQVDSIARTFKVKAT